MGHCYEGDTSSHNACCTVTAKSQTLCLPWQSKHASLATEDFYFLQLAAVLNCLNSFPPAILSALTVPLSPCNPVCCAGQLSTNRGVQWPVKLYPTGLSNHSQSCRSLCTAKHPFLLVTSCLLSRIAINQQRCVMVYGLCLTGVSRRSQMPSTYAWLQDLPLAQVRLASRSCMFKLHVALLDIDKSRQLRCVSCLSRPCRLILLRDQLGPSPNTSCSPTSVDIATQFALDSIYFLVVDTKHNCRHIVCLCMLQIKG